MTLEFGFVRTRGFVSGRAQKWSGSNAVARKQIPRAPREDPRLTTAGMNGEEDAMPRKRLLLTLSAQLLANRREYNRDYMRRWRADTQNQAKERETRERAHVARKLRLALEEYRPAMTATGEPVCGICRRLPARCQVVRLRVSSTSPGGFEELRLPYCGQC